MIQGETNLIIILSDYDYDRLLCKYLIPTIYLIYILKLGYQNKNNIRFFAVKLSSDPLKNTMKATFLPTWTVPIVG